MCLPIGYSTQYGCTCTHYVSLSLNFSKIILSIFPEMKRSMHLLLKRVPYKQLLRAQAYHVDGSLDFFALPLLETELQPLPLQSLPLLCYSVVDYAKAAASPLLAVPPLRRRCVARGADSEGSCYRAAERLCLPNDVSAGKCRTDSSQFAHPVRPSSRQQLGQPGCVY